MKHEWKNSKAILLCAVVLTVAVIANLYWLQRDIDQDDKPAFMAVATNFTEFDVITFETTTCDGACRPFKAVIRGNGRAEIIGTEFLQGHSLTKTLSSEQISAITRAMNASGIFASPQNEVRKNFVCAGPPHQTLSVTIGKNTHTMRHTCTPPPLTITQFETTICDMLGTREIAEGWFREHAGHSKDPRSQ